MEELLERYPKLSVCREDIEKASRLLYDTYKLDFVNKHPLHIYHEGNTSHLYYEYIIIQEYTIWYKNLIHDIEVKRHPNHRREVVRLLLFDHLLE